ncbi:MAG: histidine phosphatase family protein [Gammaproteobacteria bacterium]|nr:histidine phosphatase family protein [Gammaproteobacteria bacterium]MCC5870607.1 histidine phosphatase family protein [Gammaproteobacteria bacterium]
MKRLTVLRHAKSSWDEPGIGDFDRPLNRRGERDAPAMGQRLLDAGARPSLILSSPAARAIATARQVADALGYPREFLQTDPALYLASAERLLEIVSLQDDAFRDLMIVAHNPGLTDLANAISDHPIDNLATAAVMVIDLPISRWQEVLDRVRGRCVFYDSPKSPEPPAHGVLQRVCA